MKLEQYRTLWGNIDETDGLLARSPYRTIEQVIPELKALGYDGIEIPYKCAHHLGIERMKALLAANSMKCTIMVFTDGVVVPGAGILWGGPYPGFTAPTQPGESDKDKLVATHLAVWKEQVVAAQALNPTLVVSHSLKDYFTHAMAEQFFSEALRWEAENGYVVCHETHRKRFLHSPWVARDFLYKFPAMKICADLSHWVNVAETNCDDLDLTQVIEDVAPQVWHTHCRVGYDHGPQVPDPRVPEWLPYMEGHERWWDAIWRAQAARGQAVSTMIAEHGPPNYQPTLPHSREPVAHIWDVNHWIQLRRQDRFKVVFPDAGHQTSSLIPSKTQGPLPLTAPGDSILAGRTAPAGFLNDEEKPISGRKRKAGSL
jgi:sugar phosphate isomerase/epimerase